MNDLEHQEKANPNHDVPAEVSEALADLRREREANLARQLEVARLGRPTEEERRASAEAADTAQPKIATADFAQRVDTALREPPPIELASPLGLPEFDFSPAPPAATDPNFWWAQTAPFGPSFLRADFLSDGLHFSGRFTYDANPLFGFSIGSTSRFAIEQERLPASAAGRWRSAPLVEMFGRILGWTSGYDLFGGDSWCKVKLFKRQTVFQVGFGPSGGGMINRRDNAELISLIDEENKARARDFTFSGAVAMPPVDFGNLFPGTVWSELEVRIDVQLEGNSLFHFDPRVIFRGLQWPAVAI